MQSPIFIENASMKRQLPFSHRLLFLFLVVLAAACSSARSENGHSNNHPLATNNSDSSIDDTLIGLPTIDSVLQFNVMVTVIFEDSRGHFWFGSHGDGLCRYDGTNYTYFRVNHGMPAGIEREFAPGPDWSIVRKINGSNQINAIEEDKNGTIWISNGDGILCKFNGSVFVPVPVDKKGVLPLNLARASWKKEQEHLWIGAANSLGLYRYNGKTLEYFSFPKPYASERDGISAFYRDSEGGFWLGTMENGTFRYDGNAFTPINKKNEVGICRSVFQDKSGRIWITNNRFDMNYLQGDSLVNFIEEYRAKTKERVPDFGKGIQSIAQDADGNLWFGTFGSGLWRYDGKQLTHITENGTLPILLVKAMYKNSAGELLYSIGEGSVYRYDGKIFERFDGGDVKR